MPTVLYIKGYRFYFYAADGQEPAHVHVEKGDGDGKIWLEPELKPQFLHFKAQEQKEILKLVQQHLEELKEKWNEYFSE